MIENDKEFTRICREKYDNDLCACLRDEELREYFRDKLFKHEIDIMPISNFFITMIDSDQFVVSGDADFITLDYSTTNKLEGRVGIIYSNKPDSLTNVQMLYLNIDEGNMHKLMDNHVRIGGYVKFRVERDDVCSYNYLDVNGIRVKIIDVLEVNNKKPMYPHIICPECGFDRGIILNDTDSKLCPICDTPYIFRDNLDKSVEDYNADNK